MRKERQKRFEELTFTDNYMFQKVLVEDKELLCDLLELILGKKVKGICYAEMEKTLQHTASSKGIRMDVFVEDEEDTVYDVEMQTTKDKELPKRARYYQGVVDLNSISTGEHYVDLKSSIIIFICLFDPFDKGLALYHYEARCRETGLPLQDGSMYVFINACGDTSGLSEDMRSFLSYLREGKVSENPLVKRLDRGVEQVRSKIEWRAEFMTLNLLLKETAWEAAKEAKAERDAAFEERDTAFEERNAALEEVERLKRVLQENGIAIS